MWVVKKKKKKYKMYVEYNEGVENGVKLTLTK